jgi:hypothetical protein
MGGSPYSALALASLAGRRVGFRVEWANSDRFCLRLAGMPELDAAAEIRWLDFVMGDAPHRRASEPARADRRDRLRKFVLECPGLTPPG